MHATEPSPIEPAGHSCEAATVRTAPLALWRVAAVFLQALHMLFGSPAELAERQTLTRKLHAQLADWLRCGEAMLRGLLIIEAAAYPRPNARPLLHAARKRVRKPICFTAGAPDTWRVCFRCFESERHARPKPAKAEGQSKIRAFVVHEEPPAPRPSCARRRGKRVRHPPVLRQDRPWVFAKAPLASRSAWPLAERYEALLRVFNAPGAYAQRLSRRLHATPHRLHEALRAPPQAYGRVDEFDAFGAEARSRWRPHFSSG